MRLQRLTGLEQDKIVGEYKEVMAQIADLLDILAKPERVTTIIADELAALQAGVRPDQARRAAQRDRAQRAGPRHRRPDHAHRHGGHAQPHRLHQEPAAGRVPRADAAAAAASRPRRPRKTTGSTSSSSPTRTTGSCASPTAAASTGSRSGRCRRAVAQVARQADRQHVPAAGRREDHRRAAADRRLPQLPGRPLRLHGHRAGHGEEDRARRVQQPAQGRHHRGRPRRRATS